MNARDRAKYYIGIKNHLLRQSTICGICGLEILKKKDATIDHIIPLSRGGSEHISNLQVAHWTCNNKKGNSMPEST